MVVAPGRLADVGCWTGSLLVAAAERGWQGVGLEPSAWAASRARQRGVEVSRGELFDNELEPGSFRAVVVCDVVEHLTDPVGGIERLRDLLEPGGALYITVPDAGSPLARALGRRWWSVLPMHLQYFSRASMTRLLTERGLQVRSIRTHAKAFSAQYYAERLGGYSPVLRRLAVGATSVVRLQDHMVAPDFRDRMAVIAVRDDTGGAGDPDRL
jgi:SAM-dependent methyltransferase